MKEYFIGLFIGLLMGVVLFTLLYLLLGKEQFLKIPTYIYTIVGFSTGLFGQLISNKK